MNNPSRAQNQAAALLEPGAAESHAALKDAKVMMIDDDPLMTALVKKYLGNAGYKNFVATNDPREGLAMLARETPDLLLLDVLMPHLPGFDLLASLRADAALRLTPVIVLTAETSAESKRRALDLGATDFLAKPVDPSELVLRVRNTLAYLQYQHRLANFDTVTALPGHALFDRSVDAMIQRRASADQLVTLFVATVPECQQLTESLGQQAADSLAQVIAVRLERFLVSEEVLWAASAIAERLPCIARLDSQRFAVALEGMNDSFAIEASVRRLLAVLCEPVMVGVHQVWPQASVGISVAPADGDTAGELRQGAALAATQASHQHHAEARFWFASPELSGESYEKVTLASQLRGAAERGEFELHYQPKINFKNNQIIGAEALVRWNHPELGMVAPAMFIGLAQEHGLSSDLGKWVIETACQDAANWARAGLGNLKIAVNVDTAHLHAFDFCDVVRDALKNSGLIASQLVIEIGEHVVMEDLETSQALLHQLKAMGVSLSMDDFGTGYSSLSHLSQFPFDELKVDRSFVVNLPGQAADVAIVRSVVELGHRLGLSVSAEGVETTEQLASLKQLDCDSYQGFLFGEAIPSAEFQELLAAEKSR